MGADRPLDQTEAATIAEGGGAAEAGPTAMPEEAVAAAREPGNVRGDFVLCAMIGAGGAGEVWKAWDTRLARWVAIKRLARGDALTDRERFRREALAVARLDHPAIIPIHQV